MSTRETLAQVSAATATFAGPTLAAAEATGVLHEASRPFMVYVLSGGLTLVGGMFTVLMWFIKREHAAITGGIDGVRKAVSEQSTSLAALTMTVTSSFAEMRGEIARRVLIEEHGRSSSRIHEKVNKLGRSVAFLTGKLGMSQGGEDEDEREAGEGKE